MPFAITLNETPAIIECVCQGEVAKGRLERDQVLGKHSAGNRTYELYLAVAARAEPITIPHLVIDTGQLPVEECVTRCLGYLKRD